MTRAAVVLFNRDLRVHDREGLSGRPIRAGLRTERGLGCGTEGGKRPGTKANRSPSRPDAETADQAGWPAEQVDAERTSDQLQPLSRPAATPCWYAG